MSEFGERKGLLIEKASTKKMGALVVLEIHLIKIESSGFFMSRESEMGGAICCKKP